MQVNYLGRSTSGYVSVCFLLPGGFAAPRGVPRSGSAPLLSSKTLVLACRAPKLRFGICTLPRFCECRNLETMKSLHKPGAPDYLKQQRADHVQCLGFQVAPTPGTKSLPSSYWLMDGRAGAVTVATTCLVCVNWSLSLCCAMCLRFSSVSPDTIS